jgi:type II secretory pathway pseudopilin PulG
MRPRASHQINQHGSTLIELLIYVGIFSTIIGAIVGLAVLTSGQKVSSQVTADINYQGEATMAYITQTVHQASSITAPAPANTGSTLTLVMPTASVNPTSFNTFNDGTTTRLQVNEGSLAIANNLTNSHATVSGLTFTNMSLSGTKGSVQIKFTLTYRTTSQRQEFIYSKTFYGAVTIP